MRIFRKSQTAAAGTLENDLKRAMRSNNPAFVLAVAQRVMTAEGDGRRYHALMTHHFHITRPAPKYSPEEIAPVPAQVKPLKIGNGQPKTIFWFPYVLKSKEVDHE